MSGKHLVQCLETSEVLDETDSHFRSMNRDPTVYVGGSSFRLVGLAVIELLFRGKTRMISILTVTWGSFLQSSLILKMVRQFQRRELMY